MPIYFCCFHLTLLKLLAVFSYVARELTSDVNVVIVVLIELFLSCKLPFIVFQAAVYNR